MTHRDHIRSKALQEVVKHSTRDTELTCIEHWYDEAVKQEPTGILCGSCGIINAFWDDLGWWYKHTDKGYKPVCRHCFGPPRGER